MAFLRFSRDRRGYENTFLLHAAKPRGEKAPPRLLYWFRTPPHLKVGRTAFDDDARRLLQDEHPEVEFDWSRLLESAAAGSPDLNGSTREGPDGSPASPESSSSGAGDSSARASTRHRRRRGRPPGA